MWIFYGILHSLMRAVFAETSRAFAVDRDRQGFWQALAALAFLLPLAPLAMWPGDPRFYLAAAGASVILTVGALINTGLSAEKSGRELGMHMPVEALTSFCLWLLIAPSSAAVFAHNPAAAGVLALSFCAAAAALYRIRPLRPGVRAFAFALPVGISYAVAGNVTKSMVFSTAVLPLSFAYAIVNFAVMTAVMVLWLAFKKKLDTGLAGRDVLSAGLLSGLSSAIGYTCFVAGVSLAYNPGFTSVLAMLLPVWCLVWHRLRKMPDTASPVRAVLLALALAVFAGAAAFLGGRAGG